MHVKEKHTISGVAWLVGKLQKKLTIEVTMDNYTTDVVLKIASKTIAKGTLKTEELRDITRLLTRAMKDTIRFTTPPKRKR
jgi:hypothetical protein